MREKGTNQHVLFSRWSPGLLSPPRPPWAYSTRSIYKSSSRPCIFRFFSYDRLTSHFGGPITAQLTIRRTKKRGSHLSGYPVSVSPVILACKLSTLFLGLGCHQFGKDLPPHIFIGLAISSSIRDNSIGIKGDFGGTYCYVEVS